MKKNDKNLMEKLINMSTKAGAENVEVIMAKGQGQSAECRLGKIESIESSDALDIGLTVYIGKKTASVSSSRTDNDSLLKMVDRAVSMTKLTLENPFCGIASKNQVAKNWSEINQFLAA